MATILKIGHKINVQFSFSQLRILNKVLKMMILTIMLWFSYFIIFFCYHKIFKYITLKRT